MRYDLVCLPALMLNLTACSTARFSTEPSANVDFSNYRTFDIPEVKDPDTDPALVDLTVQQQIRAAVASALEQRGYERSEDSDLMVALYVKVEDKRQAESAYFGGSAYYGTYYHYNTGLLQRGIRVVDFTVGTLIVDLVDVAQNRLVWQGVIEDTFAPSERLTEAEIQRAVTKLLKDVPRRVK
jgi:hypothetical protein